MHHADLRMDPVAAQSMMQRLVALGYIQPPSEDQAKAVEMAVREQNYNLARSYLDVRRYQDALSLLQELVSKWAGTRLAFLSISRNAISRCGVVPRLRQFSRNSSPLRRSHGKKMKKLKKKTQPSPAKMRLHLPPPS